MTSTPLNTSLILAEIRRALAPSVESARALLPEQKRFVIAVSGGSDSTALMHVMAATFPDISERGIVGFVDHGLRNVDAEWELVSDAARTLGITATRLVVPEEEAREAHGIASLQNWARDARYALLFELASRCGAEFVVMGHTRDDQAETFLLRLLRGAGLDGLGAMAPHRDSRSGISVVRPLLETGREQLREILRAFRVPFAEDPSNDDGRHLRVRVRKELIPLLDSLQPRASERIAAAADELRGTSDYLSSTIAHGTTAERLRLCGGVRVGPRAFADFPRALWGRIVRHALQELRGHLLGVERGHYELLLQLVADVKSTSRIPLPGGVQAYAHRGSLYLFPVALPPRPTGAGQAVAVGPRRWRIRFSALGAAAEIEVDDSVPGAATMETAELRARRPGDRLFGSEKKLKELLSDKGVPRPYRDFVPVLAIGDDIVSCPGLLPCRLANTAVNWLLDDDAPFLDVDFPLPPRGAACYTNRRF